MAHTGGLTLISTAFIGKNKETLLVFIHIVCTFLFLYVIEMLSRILQNQRLLGPLQRLWWIMKDSISFSLLNKIFLLLLL